VTTSAETHPKTCSLYTPAILWVQQNAGLIVTSIYTVFKVMWTSTEGQVKRYKAMLSATMKNTIVCERAWNSCLCHPTSHDVVCKVYSSYFFSFSCSVFFFIQGYIRASKRNRKIGDVFLYCMFINMFLLTILIIKSGYKIGNGREICSHAKYLCQVSQWIWINSGYIVT